MSEDTKIIRLEQRLEKLESDVVGRLEAIQASMLEVKTTLVKLAAQHDNIDLRLNSQAQNQHEFNTRLQTVELSTQKNTLITSAGLFVSGCIITALTFYIINGQ